ncbi:MAG: copper resistance protein CopC [Arthrobacter sp.]|nr:copper resistance protein CopC [Arthrobacter sp.]MCU1547630.1 copper resistance protein CopC [Arthrobacter sp.]
MHNTVPTTHRKGWRFRLVLALAAAAMIPALATAPAQAHDSLQSTSPAKDSTVSTAPEQVSLTLSESPTDAASLNFSVIKVTDSTGVTLSDGKVNITDATLSTTLIKGVNGPYTVLWRAVSSDGHPIEGSYSFTVQDLALSATTPAAAAPSTSAPVTAPAAGQPVPPVSGPDNSNAPVVLGLAAAIIAAAAALFAVSHKRKTTRNQA